MPSKPVMAPPVVYDMVLAIRRLREGQFAGLYEVVELNHDGSVKRVVTDANAKGHALNMMANAAFRV